MRQGGGGVAEFFGVDAQALEHGQPEIVEGSFDGKLQVAAREQCAAAAAEQAAWGDCGGGGRCRR